MGWRQRETSEGRRRGGGQRGMEDGVEAEGYQ